MNSKEAGVVVEELILNSLQLRNTAVRSLRGGSGLRVSTIRLGPEFYDPDEFTEIMVFRTRGVGFAGRQGVPTDSFPSVVIEQFTRRVGSEEEALDYHDVLVESIARRFEEDPEKGIEQLQREHSEL